MFGVYFENYLTLIFLVLRFLKDSNGNWNQLQNVPSRLDSTYLILTFQEKGHTLFFKCPAFIKKTFTIKWIPTKNKIPNLLTAKTHLTIDVIWKYAFSPIAYPTHWVIPKRDIPKLSWTDNTQCYHTFTDVYATNVNRQINQ